MKKQIFSAFFLLYLFIEVNPCFAQAVDSATLKKVNVWVRKYTLTDDVKRQILPYVLSEIQSQKTIDSIYGRNNLADSLKRNVRLAYSDTINSVLIANGHFYLSKSRFINALKYSKRLNLTPSQQLQLVKANLELDRARHQFISSSPEEVFDTKGFTESKFPSLFTKAQYDTILSIELMQQARGDARRMIADLKQYNSGNSPDSSKDFKELVGYSLKKLIISKKFATDTIAYNTAIQQLNANLPTILKRLSDFKKTVQQQKSMQLAFNNKVAKSVAELVQKWQIPSSLIAQIQPLVQQKYAQEILIDTSTIAINQKDSLRKNNKWAFDDKINYLLLKNGFLVTENRYTHALKCKASLNLSEMQIDKLANKVIALQQSKREFETHHPNNRFDIKNFINQDFKDLFTAAQYDTLLRIETQQQALDDSHRQWKGLKDNGLSVNLDSARTVNDLSTFNLNRLVAIKKIEEDKNNTALKQALQAVNQTRPAILRQLDYAIKGLNNKSVSSGNFVW